MLQSGSFLEEIVIERMQRVTMKEFWYQDKFAIWLAHVQAVHC